TIACAFPIAPLRLPTLRKCELLLGSRNRSGSSKRSGRTTPAPQRASKPWGWHGLPNRSCKSKASPLHVQIRHTRGGAKRRGGGIRSAADHLSATLSRPALLNEEGKF